MTNQEAITKLTNIMHDDHYAWHPSILEAFRMAVDALKGAGGDWISRAEAIKCCTFGRTSLGLINELRRLPSAQPERRWIPVTERLPESIRPVIVTWKNTDPASYYRYIVGKRFIGVAHYKNGKWYWYSSTTEDFLAEYGRYDGEEFDEAIEVLAWCELPEPWKEGEKDD